MLERPIETAVAITLLQVANIVKVKTTSRLFDLLI